MSLFEDWVRTAYYTNGTANKRFWSTYEPMETRVYEDLLENCLERRGRLNMSLLDFAKKYGMKPEYAVGFLDGIKDALDEVPDVESIKEDYIINIEFGAEKLFKKMVEYKAKHLYTLPQWNNIFTEEERETFIDWQRRSGTVVLGERPGRNDSCPCGSGKKYKKCCAAE